MDVLLEAFDRLMCRPPGPMRHAFPCRVMVRRRHGHVDAWAVAAAALANMSGMLELSITSDQLDQAVAYGWTLMTMGGVYTWEDFKAEFDEVIRLIGERFKESCLWHDPAFFKTGKGEDS